MIHSYRQPAGVARGLVAWATLLLSSAVCWAEPPTEADAVLFNRDVRPILSDHCFACHGPDQNKREADLRLDTEIGLLGEPGSTGVVQAGMPDESELYRRITSSSDDRMPPEEFGKPLRPEDVAILRRWIEQGAAWEGHWSFQPIARPAPPVSQAADEARQPIDAFVAATLRREQLEASPPADPVTLVRRLYLDLTGLPPTPQQVDAFLADDSPQAYQRLVDQLLASPHYGERMAIWWLDLVRYADSVGYHGDQPVSVFPYRDYVIQAFNDNMPFDQFTVEQLAGDLLPNASLRERIASGYNRLGMMSAEGGVQPKEYLAKYIAERVRNVGGTWLGVTLGCCECHDHKYDPLTSRDFYSMEAFFADIQERGLYGGAHESGDWGPRVQVPTPEQVEQRERLQREIAAVRKQLDTTTAELAEAQSAWEQQQLAAATTWTVLEPSKIEATGETKFERLEDGSWLASGDSPATSRYLLTFEQPPAGITAFRVDALPHESLPKQGPGRASNGNFVLTEFVAKLQPPEGSTPVAVALQNASATYEQSGAAEATPTKKWAASDAIDGDQHGAGFGWAIMEQVGKPHHAVFETVADTVGGSGTTLTIELWQQHESPGHTLGRFRISATTASRPQRASQLEPQIAAAIRLPAAERTEAQQEELARYYRSIAPLLMPQREQLAALEKQLKTLESQIPTTLITVAVEPRTIRILPRGNWMDDSGPEVLPAVPGVLPQPAPHSGRLTRLDLARWIVSAENPLTARTLANRLWKLYFGAGLSTRLDDLGSQGGWPSHPELLDYLAGQLIDSGWDIKRLVKQIVMSETYRQSSALTPELLERDPYNRWLARQGRYRLEAELVRDSALHLSGLLYREVGGPSVKPYQPPGYWAYLNFPTREWQNGTGSQLYRRGLYTHWQRQYLHPALLAFDAPSREECVADRARSNTPLQSLVLMNDTEFVEAARAFAQRVLVEGGSSTTERITWAFRQAVSREPQPEEIGVLAELFANHLQQYSADPQAADKLLAVGAAPLPPQLERVQLAAWTSITRAILNLHETITRY